MIRLVLYYGCESWTLHTYGKNSINSFERKILQHILGLVKENNVWKVRYNNELYELYKEPGISITVKLRRLQWAGHVHRMGNEHNPKKILYAAIGGKRCVDQGTDGLMLWRRIQRKF